MTLERFTRLREPLIITTRRIHPHCLLVARNAHIIVLHVLVEQSLNVNADCGKSLRHSAPLGITVAVFEADFVVQQTQFVKFLILNFVLLLAQQADRIHHEFVHDPDLGMAFQMSYISVHQDQHRLSSVQVSPFIY